MNASGMDRRKWRKLAVSMGVGMIMGAAGAAALLAAGDSGAFGVLAGDRLSALFVALVYLLMGLAVLVGATAPQVGSTFLNVEDAQELREERPKLMPSALSCVALAAGLVALAMTGERLSPEFALSLFGIALAMAWALSRTIVGRSDELMRGLMREGSAASFYFFIAIVGGWAVLAHLGFVAAPTMLAIIALIYAITLLGSLWVVGRRGLLVPR